MTTNLPTWFPAWFGFTLTLIHYAEYTIHVPAQVDDRFRARLRAWERVECARKAVEHD